MIKSRKTLFMVLGLVFLIQLIVLGAMVWKQVNIGQTGKTYKFELDAIDPVDPLRGKYIILNPKANRFVVPDNTIPPNRMLHATFLVDERGFAQIKKLTVDAPRHENYLTISADKIAVNKPEIPIDIHYPFTKYFMNEDKALPAEKLTRRANRDPNLTCYAEVAISKGKSRLLSVKVNDIPIEDWIEQQEQAGDTLQRDQ